LPGKRGNDVRGGPALLAQQSEQYDGAARRAAAARVDPAALPTTRAVWERWLWFENWVEKRPPIPNQSIDPIKLRLGYRSLVAVQVLGL